MFDNIRTRRLEIPQKGILTFASDEAIPLIYETEGGFVSAEAEKFDQGIYWYLSDEEWGMSDAAFLKYAIQVITKYDNISS